MGIPDISEFNVADFSEFLGSFDTVLTDLDGVLWVLGNSLDGSQEAIAALEALGKRIFYVTNNGTRTVAQYVSSLSSLGYKITEAQMITPAVTVAQFLRRRNFQGKAQVLACPAFRSDLQKAGVACAQSCLPEDVTLEGMKSYFRDLDPNISALVMDYTPTLTYVQLQAASVLLRRPDCLFVVGATDYDVPITPQITLLGPGYFVDLLKKATRREPIVVAKPSSMITQLVMEQHPTLDPHRTLFIGDSLNQDVVQAVLSGFIPLLVLSGVSSLKEAENAPPTMKPKYVTPSLKALLPSLHCLVNKENDTGVACN